MNWTRHLLRLALGRRLPKTAGTLTVAGIATAVTIRRDRWGIPVVEAATDADAWFGLGFCHAQDRATQLEFYRRASTGTLGELVGKEGLSIDRLSRRIGFWRTAGPQLAALAPNVRATLDAYARGINAGLTAGLPRKPHEFAVLGGEPGPWDAADVVAFIKLQTLLMTGNWDVELARLQILLADGPDAVAALDPAPANNGPLIDPRPAPGEDPRDSTRRDVRDLVSHAADRLAADLKAFLRATPGRAAGSNSWALAGSRTAAGRPLVANDPHASPNVPPPWYLVHLRTPEWAVCGATAVGVPAVAAGHNGTVAWATTAGLIDNTDLYVEELGRDGRSVRQPDGSFARCQVVTETIKVKGGADVVEEVLVTPRGPIVSPALEGVDRALSMRAVWLDPLPARGLLDVHKAKSFAQFREAFREWPVTPQHFVYADTSGTVGWVLAGQAPARRGAWGMVPQRGSDPAAEWVGLVPFEEMPHATDPPTGFYATANNPPLPEGEGPFLGYDWVNGYRAAAITADLERRRDWDVAGCTRVQLSRRSKPWDDIRDAVLSLPAADPDARRGLDLLRAWDGVVGPDSAAASVYEFFLCELATRAAKAKAPNGWERALGKGFGGLVPHTLFADRRFGHLVELLREQPAGWFARPWPEEAADALGAAVRRLERESGRRAEHAAWGDVRPLKLKHLVFGDVTGLGRAFNLGPVPGGDSNTPFQATVQPTDPLAPPSYMPNMRMVVDVGAWSGSRFVLCGGQSGNPLSPHYDDLFELWRRGEGVPIPWTAEEVAASTAETLTLRPG